MAGIERKSLDEPDEAADYGEQGKAARVTLGMAGFGIGSESTVWLSTLRPGLELAAEHQAERAVRELPAPPP